MVKWTDSNIQWQNLSAKQIAYLVDTWGKPLNEDGTVAKGAKAKALATAKTPAKKAVPAKAVAKPAVRQKHTGADGEIKFVDHRNLWVGFWGGKVVITKRTKEACQTFLTETFGVEQNG
jgi:hypothetical protein